MKGALKLAGFVISLAVCFGFGFAFSDLRTGRLPNAEAMGVLWGGNGEFVGSKAFRDTYGDILGRHFKKVDAANLKWAGMEGLFASLGDPYTAFLRPTVADDFRLETTASLVGVGARLTDDPLGARVTTVFDDGPGSKAGLKANDIVTAVDGKSVVGLSVDDIVVKIRGEEGTKVQLSLIRAGSEKPILMTVRRAKVTAPTVEHDFMKESQVGYVRVVSFSEPTSRQFEEALNKVDRNQIKGLVIDLRNNPGGLLEVTVEMLSQFVEDKVVVKMKGKDGREEVAVTPSGYKRRTRYPIAILMNEDTASAAEIFAGVLQDYKLATLVGEHSFGKAAVQNVIRLVDGSSAKITVARYVLPSGRDIGRKVDEDGQFLSGGLQPDVEAALPTDSPVEIGNPKLDPQLKAALDVIKSKQG